MTDTTSPDSLLVETIRTQEFLTVEFRRISGVLESQQNELAALGKACAALSASLEARLNPREEQNQSFEYSLPYGLRPRSGADETQEHLRSVRKDIDAAFYPDASPQLLESPFVRYRQLQRLDLRGQRVCVLTTASSEYDELREATQTMESIELRLHSINGPLTCVTHSGQSPPSSETSSCNIETVLMPVGQTDILWIPDPHLSGLALRCRGLVERICATVKGQFIFSIDTGSWTEDGARARVHQAGFTEISRLIDTGDDVYVTRRHEAKAFHVHAAPARSTTASPVQYLIASKLPSASFRIGTGKAIKAKDDHGAT